MIITCTTIIMLQLSIQERDAAVVCFGLLSCNSLMVYHALVVFCGKIHYTTIFNGYLCCSGLQWFIMLQQSFMIYHAALPFNGLLCYSGLSVYYAAVVFIDATVVCNGLLCCSNHSLFIMLQ